MYHNLVVSKIKGISCFKKKNPNRQRFQGYLTGSAEGELEKYSTLLLGWDVAQWVECLSGMHETLGSTPSTE